ALLRTALAEGPLAWFELRRKLPAYAVPQAEEVLKAQLSQGLLFLHPPGSKRGGERYGVQPSDPKDYLRSELASLFNRLAELGFTQTQLRASALELLHDEEWSSPQESRPLAAAHEERAHMPTPPAQPSGPSSPPGPSVPEVARDHSGRPQSEEQGPNQERLESAEMGSPSL